MTRSYTGLADNRTGVSGNDIAGQVVIAEQKLVTAKERVLEMEKLLKVSAVAVCCGM